MLYCGLCICGQADFNNSQEYQENLLKQFKDPKSTLGQINLNASNEFKYNGERFKNQYEQARYLGTALLMLWTKGAADIAGNFISATQTGLGYDPATGSYSPSPENVAAGVIKFGLELGGDFMKIPLYKKTAGNIVSIGDAIKYSTLGRVFSQNIMDPVGEWGVSTWLKDHPYIEKTIESTLKKTGGEATDLILRESFNPLDVKENVLHDIAGNITQPDFWIPEETEDVILPE